MIAWSVCYHYDVRVVIIQKITTEKLRKRITKQTWSSTLAILTDVLAHLEL